MKADASQTYRGAGIFVVDGQGGVRIEVVEDYSEDGTLFIVRQECKAQEVPSTSFDCGNFGTKRLRPDAC